jgi:hypothetical protein
MPLQYQLQIRAGKFWKLNLKDLSVTRIYESRPRPGRLFDNEGGDARCIQVGGLKRERRRTDIQLSKSAGQQEECKTRAVGDHGVFGEAAPTYSMGIGAPANHTRRLILCRPIKTLARKIRPPLLEARQRSKTEPPLSDVGRTYRQAGTTAHLMSYPRCTLISLTTSCMTMFKTFGTFFRKVAGG